ncbi:MAG: preprotein translocase subunit SecE [Clostridia bacterium]|nr:preprotein translocase subunit SecE [Clostridia bacterium]MDE6867735.1 preprotein translocase subunit SecE [Clostridia bacterium]
MASKNDNKVKKPNIFVRMGRKLKETFSELKRVTWPTFPKVIKGTCVVLVVVLVFTVIVTAINYGLEELLKVITNIKGFGE